MATSRAMPTPFFFSRLPEALLGLMTKQTFRACSPSIALIKNSLNYIKTSNNRLLGTYVGMDWSPLGLVSRTCIWEPFPSCLCPFA